MLFSIGYSMILGLTVAFLVFSGGRALGLTGLQAMVIFYGLALVTTIVMGIVKKQPEVEYA
jgi:ferrous iron transport protein B